VGAGISIVVIFEHEISYHLSVLITNRFGDNQKYDIKPK